MRAGVKSAAVAVLGMSLSSGCQSPSALDSWNVDPKLRASLSTDTEVALQKLEAVEAKLQNIREFESRFSVVIAAFALCNDTLNQGYIKSDAHLKSIAEQIIANKKILADPKHLAEDTQRCLEWGTEMDGALDKIHKLVLHVAANGTMPEGWVAPVGFEYIVEYRNKVFAGK